MTEQSAADWTGTLTYSCGCVWPTMGVTRIYDYLCSSCYTAKKLSQGQKILLDK